MQTAEICMDAAGDVPTLTRDEAAALGFTPEQMDDLLAAGILVPAGPFAIDTPERLAWLIRERKQLAFEKAELVRFHREALERIERADRALSRFDEQAAALTLQLLPRSSQGKILAKSVILEGCKSKLVRSAGGPKVADEADVLAYARQLCAEGLLPEGLAAGIRATRTLTAEGEDAVHRLTESPGEWSPQVLKTPVKAFVESLPGEPDPETGELRPATIPGVVIEPASERWSFE